jgi:hypothetical protein
VRGPAEEQGFAGRGPGETEREADERRLPASVRPRDADELAGGDFEVDSRKDRRAARIGVGNAVQRDR